MDEIVLTPACGRCGEKHEVRAEDMVRAQRVLDRVVPICAACMPLEELAVRSGAAPKGAGLVRTDAGPDGDQWEVIRRGDR